MAQTRHLKKAPIQEALLDFRVRRRPDFKVDAFRGLRDRLDEFPVIEERRQIESLATVSKSGESHQSFSTRIDGYRFKSDSGREIAQFGLEGFTYNLLRPYRDWNELENAALELLQLYEEVAHPMSIVRVATRFINRLHIPRNADLENYLTTPPRVPPGLEAELAIGKFVTRIVVHTSDAYSANITRRLDKVSETHIEIILDIDAYKLLEGEDEMDVPLQKDRIKPLLDRLHRMKNDMFFKSVTDTALAPYE